MIDKFKFKSNENYISDILDEFNNNELDHNYSEDSDIYSDIYKNLKQENPKAVKIISAIILKAKKMNASDIHIEPYEYKVRLRFRIDGVLKIISNLSKENYEDTVSRFKILAKINIIEKRIPQDGKFKFKIDGKNIDFRLSLIPTIYGEKLVIRILNRDFNNFSIDNLLLDNKSYEILMKGIKSKSGLIINAGPTSSGKSTTLYSILNYKNDESVNILTVEDPVEYELEGINQIQCNNEIGLDFAKVLRAFLRQDPDIIMLGEIRDKESAEISIKAALTGHLVFSTLHSNDAVQSLNRLLNIGLDNHTLSSSLVLILSQRLLRKLCPKCKTLDKNWKAKLKMLDLEAEKYEAYEFYTHSNCEHCSYTGYLGREAVFEFFLIDSDIKEMISNKKHTSEIYKTAISKGMVPLIEASIKKVLSKTTSLDELLRQL